MGNLIATIEPDIQGHLIVPTACGVKFAPRGPDPIGESGFDIHVNILEFQFPDKLPLLDVREDAVQTVAQFLEFILGDDSRALQRSGMRQRALNVVGIEPPIEGDTFAITLHKTGGSCFKSAFPHEARKESGMPPLQRKCASHARKSCFTHLPT